MVNSDHTVETPEDFADHVRGVIEHTLHHHQSQITRVEVHFSDEDGRKNGGNDKRCIMEARLAGRQPIAVSDQADSLDKVIQGAADKLKHAIVSILGKEHDRHPN